MALAKPINNVMSLNTITKLQKIVEQTENANGTIPPLKQNQDKIINKILIIIKALPHFLIQSCHLFHSVLLSIFWLVYTNQRIHILL